MRLSHRAIASLLVLVVAACGREPVGTDRAPQGGVPGPDTEIPAPRNEAGPYSDDLVMVDPAQLQLISTATELAAGTYRYNVVGDAVPEVLPGAVLYGGGEQEYLRRVWQVERAPGTLVAQTTSAFPHEVIRGGRHSLQDAPADGLAGLGAEFFAIADTFDIAGDVCAWMADSVGVQVCNKDRTLINKGWVEVEGRVDTLRILSGRVVVEGALDGSYVVDAGGSIVPGTGRRPTFAPCNQYPDATGCFARVGTALRNFLHSVGIDPNVLPPLRMCVPGTPITIAPGQLFPFRPPTIRICRISDWGALPTYTLPSLSSVTLGFVPRITVSDMLVRALGSATLKLSIPVPKLAVIKCFDHGNGFLCLKAGVIIVLNAGFVESGGTARLDGVQRNRVELTWSGANGWGSPQVETLESDQSFGFEPEGADTINVRIGPAAVLEAAICFGPNSKSSCVDETTGTTEKSGAGFLLNLQIGVAGKLQVGTYLDGAWSRDSVYGNWHLPIDLLSELEVEFGLKLPKILIQPDKNLKTDIPPLQWGRTTMGSYHGTGILKVNATTINPPPGMDDYTVTVARRDTFPVLEPAGTDRLGLASWELPLSAGLVPNGTVTFEGAKGCGVAYSDALIAATGGTLTAAFLKGARRLGLGIPNYQIETLCALLIADYVLRLEGVPDQCTIDDGAVRIARLTQWNLIAGTTRTSEVSYVVDCSVVSGPPGDLEVTVASTGSDLPSGYRLQLDGGTPVNTAANDVINLTGVASRAGRLLRIEDIPPNCSVVGDNPKTVTVIAEALVSVQFNVNCLGVQGDIPPLPGTVIVRTLNISAGEPGNLDVAIDGATAVSATVGQDVRFETVAAGQHVVSLAGLRPDCRLTGPSSHTVVLPSGGEILVTFEVSCSGAAPGEATGGVRIAVNTTGWPIDPNGYLLRIGSFEADLATSDTLTVEQLAPGAIEVWLDGVAANCQVQGVHPRPVTIGAGTVQQVAFAVSCQAPAALWFTSTTTGSDVDPDGYTVVVNGTASKPVAANGAVAITGLVPGTAGVALEGVAPNCTPEASFPQTVELTPGQTQTMYIDVNCVSLRRLGELEVVLRAWRGVLPAGPYTVLIEGRERGLLVPGQPTLIKDVISGRRALEIAGLPEGWRTFATPTMVAVGAAQLRRVVVWVVAD